MKKYFTLFFLTLMAFSTYAQRSIDLGIDSIMEPTRLDTYEDGVQIKTDWPLSVVLRNNGTDTIQVGDTMLWATAIKDIVLDKIIRSAPGNNQFYFITFDRQIAPSDTFHYSVNLTMTGGMQFSKDVQVIFIAQMRTITDPNTANNTATRNIVWYNLNDWNVSLNDVQYLDKVNIYPNPAKDEINVEVLMTNFNEIHIELYDLTGKLVVSASKADQFTDNSYKLNTSALDNGMYLLKVRSGDQVNTTKVIVNK